MNYRVSHKTVYEYASSVSICHNKAHLTPRSTSTQICLASKITVTPNPAVVETRLDYFGNTTTFLTVQEPHQRLIVDAQSTVSVLATEFYAPEETHMWEIAQNLIFSDLSLSGLEACEFLYDSPQVELSDDLYLYAKASFPPKRPILEGLLELMARIHQDFKYMPNATTISTPLAEVLHKRRGVCQDFAHLMIGCVRSVGLPARYVSGYLLTQPPPGKEKLVGADASHAWLAVFIPNLGWVDFDPTNNSIPSDQHITLAWGRDFSEVSPIRGVALGGGSQTLTVSVDVNPIG